MRKYTEKSKSQRIRENEGSSEVSEMEKAGWKGELFHRECMITS